MKTASETMRDLMFFGRSFDLVSLDPDEHDHDPREVFPVKCPLVNVFTHSEMLAKRSEDLRLKGWCVGSPDEFIKQDWEALNWNRWNNTMLEGE
jgi:hypothetical protein